MDNLTNENCGEWSMLSDPLLVMIFKTLEVKDIVSCSTVCTNWNTICQDNLLWKYLFRRDFMKTNRKNDRRDKELTLKLGAESWKDEYVRLKEQFPCVKKQTLKGHTDEVLHAAFSHNGLEIASCSKVLYEFISIRKSALLFFPYHDIQYV